ALDRFNNLYICDTQNARIRKVLPNGQISTALGGGAITILTPIAVTVDLAGNMFVADATAEVHEYTPAGAWTVAAGINEPGYDGDGGLANVARLTQPLDLAFDTAGNLYIADKMRVRQVDTRAIIHTVAGANFLHSIGDGGPAASAILNQPSGVTMDGIGNLYIA